MSSKILVVDDDAWTREMLTEMIESLGYIVDTAENGAEAIDKYVESLDIDLIISDMNMPVMNGLELIKELRNTKLDVPVIILTGNNEFSVAIDAMKSGANDYLLKDENIMEMISFSIKKILDKSNLEKKNVQLMADLAMKNSELEIFNQQLLDLNEALTRSRQELAVEKEEVKKQREAAELRSRFIRENRTLSVR